MKTMLVLMVLVLFSGCAADGTPLFEGDSGADGGDSDSDTDTDTDGDTDTDTDTDGDVDTDCSGDGICDNPPDNYCSDDGHAVTYTGNATCVDDECSYETTIEDCITEEFPDYVCNIDEDGSVFCGPPGATITSVEGEFQLSTSANDFEFQGDLSLPEMADAYYGYCAYSTSTGLFEFEVGDAPLADIGSATELYVKFDGIVGPPTEGVYSDPVAKIVKDDPGLKTLFGSAIIKNGVNQFSFNQPNPADNANCFVRLFAAAVSGETTPVAEVEFGYYVEFHCTSLDDVEDAYGQPLTAFIGYFYFGECENL